MRLKNFFLSRCVVPLLLFGSIGFSQAPPPACSTQKVNGNCILVFDRLDPVSLPTIQMRQDARITVRVIQPLPYETLTLDPTSLQGVAPSDQSQGLVTALVASLKGVATPVTPLQPNLAARASGNQGVAKVEDELKSLESYLDDPFPVVQTFITNLSGFYAQIQEAVAPLPRPLDNAGHLIRAAAMPTGTPVPWVDYPGWRTLLVCELSTADCPQGMAQNVMNLVYSGYQVQILLTPVAPPPPSTAPPAAPLRFDNATFDALAITTDNDIQALLSSDDRQKYGAVLANLRTRETALIAAIQAYASAWLPGVTAVNKDLQSYFVNLKETASAAAAHEQEVGHIDDPHHLSPAAAAATHQLGRVVAYSVNAVNQIGTMTTSVPTTAQKTAIVTISVLYADPIFEVSTGALFSLLPNRTFANQTLVNTNTGGIPATGDIIIAQSLTRPIVLPYVAANFRLGHDFLVASRRSAAYFTTAVSFNSYNTTAEYAVGPSFSWRMIMLSPLMHIGHDMHLTQGETVGEIWCNTGATAGSPTACIGAPPPPSSKYFWRVAFALGIGIRVPTSFGTITGH
jgi:hypothetical protein